MIGAGWLENIAALRIGRQKKSKHFFFEKKKQKTFICFRFGLSG